MERLDAKVRTDLAPRVALRPVAPADEGFLLAVYASSRADELAQVDWDDAQKMSFLRMQFDAQREEYSARYPDARYEVILFDGQPAGRLWVGEDREQMRLLDIALLPEFQNRGIGTFIVRRLIEEAAATARPLRHMVFILNTGAKRFYERLGFVVFEEYGGAYHHMEWRGDEEAVSG